MNHIQRNMNFPNRAGDHLDTDDILRAELKAAGIPTLQEAEDKPSEFMANVLRRASGEVKTSVMGNLHGWKFERAWRYWMCTGPGLDVETAERLHSIHGRVVRVNGDASCPSPRERFKGLACGSYHVDTPEGLKALADAIRSVVEKNASSEPKTGRFWVIQRTPDEGRVPTQWWYEGYDMLGVEFGTWTDDLLKVHRSLSADVARVCAKKFQLLRYDIVLKELPLVPRPKEASYPAETPNQKRLSKIQDILNEQGTRILGVTWAENAYTLDAETRRGDLANALEQFVRGERRPIYITQDDDLMTGEQLVEHVATLKKTLRLIKEKLTEFDSGSERHSMNWQRSLLADVESVLSPKKGT